ncbi:MAG: hypothetical protein ABJF04_04030 [Reichenbachiella sp.]|uniref:hypothetical protein n=1 Tax=Reichenbachiella sp. TaxID=2184521 RepID=UPI003265998E
MEARETDKLFRDKLKNLASTPTEDSWARLESMLDEKEATPWFTYARVAAAVLLLIVSASVFLVWNQESDSRETEVAEIVKPSESTQTSNKIVPEVNEENAMAVEEPEESDNQKVIPSGVKKKIESKNINNEHAPKQEPNQTIPEPESESLEVELTNQSIAQVAEEPAEIGEKPKKKRFKSIKITYKRGNTQLLKQEEMIAEHKTDTTGGSKIKELWEQTKEIKPGDLWADIRDAKDNLFQRKENSKKNNVKNLNK